MIDPGPLYALLLDLRRDLEGFADHKDNTRSLCRQDLESHDCCYVCNRVGAALKAYAAESGPL